MNYYPLVYEAFLVAAELSHAPEHAIAEALQRLQPSLDHLRRSYRNQPYTTAIHPGYSGTNALAYLLAYVPGYIVQGRMALDFAEVAEMSPQPQRVGLFCSGPCPEAVALVEILSERQRRSGNGLHLDLFEIGADDWAPVRQALLAVGCGLGRPDSLIDGVETHHFDIRRRPTGQTAEVISDLDLAVFQNYDNELGTEREAANQTIEAIAALLAPGSKLILSDLFKSYRNHESMAEALQPYGQVGRLNSGYRGVRHEQPGEFLQANLFDPFPTQDFLLLARTGHVANFLVLDRF